MTDAVDQRTLDGLRRRTTPLRWLRARLELPIATVTRDGTRWALVMDDGEVLELGPSGQVLRAATLARTITDAGGVLPDDVHPRHVLAALSDLEPR